MPRPRRVSTADTLAPVPADLEQPAPAQPSPVAAVEPEIAPEPPPRSPARQHLADTIETVRQLEAEVQQTSAGIEPARNASYAARRALDDAEDVLKRARPRDTYNMPSTPYSVWGSQAEYDDAERRARAAAEAPPMSVADAKAAVKVAKDALDTARRALQWHEDKLRTAQQRLNTHSSSIRSAVRLVLREDPATLALATECRRLATRAAAAQSAFREILWGDVVQLGSPFYGWDQVADARDGTAEAMADWAVSREWGAAIAALSTDPDAPLPMPSAA